MAFDSQHGHGFLFSSRLEANLRLLKVKTSRRLLSSVHCYNSYIFWERRAHIIFWKRNILQIVPLGRLHWVAGFWFRGPDISGSVHGHFIAFLVLKMLSRLNRGFQTKLLTVLPCEELCGLKFGVNTEFLFQLTWELSKTNITVFRISPDNLLKSNWVSQNKSRNLGHIRVAYLN
jgi:hypothetical protein